MVFVCSGNASLHSGYSAAFISVCGFLEAGWFPASKESRAKSQELCLNPFVISRMQHGLWHSLILVLCLHTEDNYGTYCLQEYGGLLKICAASLKTVIHLLSINDLLNLLSPLGLSD